METTPRIMVAGARGFVGCRAMEHFPSAIAVDSALLRNPGRALQAFVRAYQPDVILNAAAISDIGVCEKDPEGSYLANVVLPMTLAAAAEEIGAKLISFSSDQVYTGCTADGPYREDQILPEPTNQYARHKLEAERRVLDIHPSAVLLRATWMYDMPLYGHANRGNFLVNTVRAVMQGKPVCVPICQYRGITYVRQVVSLIDPVFDLPGGVYNYGSENALTMKETANALLKVLGLEGQVQDTLDTRHNLWMDCKAIKEHGIFFDTTVEGFQRCTADYGLR